MDATRGPGPPVSVADMRLPAPVWLDEHATLEDVARMMSAASVSAVIVGRDAAIITERDLVCAMANGEASGVRAVDVATRDAVRFPADGPIVVALAEMLQIGLRHLVIVGPDNLPCAVLPLGAAAAVVLEAAQIPTWLSALRIVLRVEETDR